VVINVLFNISILQICLKNRQINEQGQKQGKFSGSENFSAMLSTETVDSFALATKGISLQPRQESMNRKQVFAHD
jgi:hypothetical protein